MDSKQTLYLDYAATTPLDPQVYEAMEPWLRTQFANPSSPYTLGHQARRAVDQARATIAEMLHCSPQELVFTSGGTESDNMAIFGVARQFGKGRIITSAIEHAAVGEPCRQLSKQGFDVQVLPVGEDGIVSAEAAVAAINEQTILASIMLANNEIGAIQPVADIAYAIKAANSTTLVHTDACQAAGAIDLNVAQLGVDLLTINASKMYGPKGIGLLYVKRGTRLKPLLYGGDQEQGLRPGTENVAAIIGFAKAVQLAEERRAQEVPRLTALRDQLIDGITTRISGVRLNGSRAQRLPNNVNITVAGVDGESLLLYLDHEGIQASLGSACAAGSLDPSHVLLALGHSQEDARRSLRMTIGLNTTQADIDRVLAVLPPVITKLRSLH